VQHSVGFIDNIQSQDECTAGSGINLYTPN